MKIGDFKGQISTEDKVIAKNNNNNNNNNNNKTRKKIMVNIFPLLILIRSNKWNIKNKS